jgi:hypothetical protein
MAVSVNPPFQYAAAGTVVTLSKLPAGLKDWNLATKTNKWEKMKLLHGEGDWIGLWDIITWKNGMREPEDGQRRAGVVRPEADAGPGQLVCRR